MAEIKKLPETKGFAKEINDLKESLQFKENVQEEKVKFSVKKSQSFKKIEIRTYQVEIIYIKNSQNMKKGQGVTTIGLMG